MPYFHSFQQIRRKLARAVPNRQKREFILGYLEGQGERAGQNWRISSPRLKEALRKLEIGHESTEPVWRQILPDDVSKVKQQLGNLPGQPLPQQQNQQKQK